MNPSFGNIAKVLPELSSGPDFKIALGLLDHYDCGQNLKWESVVALPREIAKTLHYEVVGRGYLRIKNPEVLHELGVNLPVQNKKYNINVIHIDNIYIAGIETQLSREDISQLGWWSGDFSGYGSLVEDPFSVFVDKDFVYKNLKNIGYTAMDVVEWESSQEKSWEGFFQKKFLEEKILPFFQEKKVGVRIADGHYLGRSLGMKRGAENPRDIFPKTIQDLQEFAGLGTFIQQWLRE